MLTDRRIIVFDTDKFSATNHKHVIRELPCIAKIGPGQGLSFRPVSLGDRRYINRRFCENSNRQTSDRPTGSHALQWPLTRKDPGSRPGPRIV